MTKYRKKPVIIEATQIKASDFDNDHPNPDHICGVIYDPTARVVLIPTLEGEMRGNIGDWIITGVKGEKYPCKPDIFAATYEPADSTSPAPGAAAMREALESYDYWIENATTGSDRHALRRASDALANFVRSGLTALPAREVPEAVRAWAHCHDSYSSTRRTWEADTDMRDWIMKEYGL